MINTHTLGELKSGEAGRGARSRVLLSPKASCAALGAASSAVKRDDLRLCLALVRHIWTAVFSSRLLRIKKGVGLLEQDQHKITEMMKRLQHKGRLRELGLFMPKKRRLWGVLIAASQ